MIVAICAGTQPLAVRRQALECPTNASHPWRNHGRENANNGTFLYRFTKLPKFTSSHCQVTDHILLHRDSHEGEHACHYIYLPWAATVGNSRAN